VSWRVSTSELRDGFAADCACVNMNFAWGCVLVAPVRIPCYYSVIPNNRRSPFSLAGSGFLFWGLCGLAFDIKPQALGVDAACSACVSQLAQAVGFDRAFFDEFVKPRAAYAETFTSVGNAEVFDRHSSEVGMCGARVRHMT
jgi:hypothetical protein